MVILITDYESMTNIKRTIAIENVKEVHVHDEAHHVVFSIEITLNDNVIRNIELANEYTVDIFSDNGVLLEPTT